MPIRLNENEISRLIDIELKEKDLNEKELSLKTYSFAIDYEKEKIIKMYRNLIYCFFIGILFLIYIFLALFFYIDTIKFIFIFLFIDNWKWTIPISLTLLFGVSNILLKFINK